MTKDGRIRLFEIVQYDEFWKPSKALTWLDKISCDYIAVIHDKDYEDGKAKGKHYHIAVRLKDARTLDDIAKNCEIQKQYIEIKKNFNDACAYLFHLTSKARVDQKYEYDGSAVISCKHISYEEIKSRSEDFDSRKTHDAEIKQLLYKYGNCELSKSELLKKLSSEDYDKYAFTYRKMREYRIMKVRNRDMQVIYITGPTGTGKTTLAKFFAKVQNYDFFVSGSGKDVLDGYDKEECIIFDDLRADVFTKAELFKLTDNNTNSSVKSRYNNKDISYCKLMIITSIKAPHELYNWDDDVQESFKQFTRRLGGYYLYIDEDGLVVKCEYFDGRITRKVQDFTMNQVFLTLGIERRLGGDLFTKIVEKVHEEVDKTKAKYGDDVPF